MVCMNNEKLNSSLQLLRQLWKEGCQFRSCYDESSNDSRPRNLFFADVMGWVERTKIILRNVFFSSKCYDGYLEALNSCLDDRGDYDDAKCISVTSEYIKTIGQLLKYGFVKDPYSGIDNDESKICFVAMWFNEEMASSYSDGIKPAIEALGFDAVRIDKVQHNERIDSKIFEIIRKARFLVADFTGNRDGVYYEAGFAAGQGIPVIHVCRSDWFDKLHFDVGTINTIKYSTPKELRNALTKRVSDTIGRYVEKDDVVMCDDDMPF